MRIVFIGASGFLGRAAVRQLRDGGHEVVTVDRVDADHQADIGDLASLDALEVADVDVVVNAAALVPRAGETVTVDVYLRANATGPHNVATWSGRIGAKRMVSCSTLAVVGRPWPVPLTEQDRLPPSGSHIEYTISKLAGELLGEAACSAAGVAWVNLRFSALYGPGMAWHGAVAAFVDAAIEGRRPRLNANGQIHADFLHIEDAATLVALAATGSAVGTLNAASGVETSLIELVDACSAAVGAPSGSYELVDAGSPARASVDMSHTRTALGAPPARPVAVGIEDVTRWRRTVLAESRG